MLTRGLKQLLKPNLLRAQKNAIGHIKNMNEENARVRAEEASREPVLLKNDRVYKPTYTLEFNRIGEALLYSADPLKN